MLAPMRHPAMESNNDSEEVQSAKIQAEFLAHENKPIRSVYNVGPSQTLRHKILSLSLFPNIYDRSMLVRHG
jgi:hypothetical protein